MGRDPQFNELLRAVSEGRFSRRDLLKRSAALGLGASAIATLLAACGGSSSTTTSGGGTTTSSGGAATTATSGSSSTGPATPVFNAPTAASPVSAAAAGPRGGKGEVKLLLWQAPTTLNVHQSQGTKDYLASRIVLEPLADFDKNTQMVPILAAEVPSVENGAVAKDGTSVTWKLRQGVKWHDGQPFTADDVVFTYKYLSDPATAATTAGRYQPIQSVDKVDDNTVKVTFKQPTPGWYLPFTTTEGCILPQHILKDAVGANAKNAPFNLKPTGTGAYKVEDFKPGDVATYVINNEYWRAGVPHFDRVSLKGGGDATSAARAALQTGETDYAWNLQVEPNVIQSMMSAGKGQLMTWPGNGTEKLLVNSADPNQDVNGEKAYYKTQHPHFKVPEVRQALAAMIDRKTIAEQLYGPGGKATGQTQNENAPYMLPDNDPAAQWKFDVKAANDLLDKAGAAKGPSGLRELNGRPLKWTYQTSVNSVRQKTQEIVKQALVQAGCDADLKSIDAAVYFSGDPGNNDTTGHFYADLEMYTNGAGVFPLDWYRRYASVNPDTDIDQKSNGWSSYNPLRYQSDKFNKIFQQASTELDPQKSIAAFQDMQRTVLQDVAEIGVVARLYVSAVSNRLTGLNPSPWAEEFWNIQDWSTK